MSDGFEADECAQPDPDDLVMVVGAPVTHAQFGIGHIVAVDGSGPDARLVVRFGGRTRRIQARYLSLYEG